MKTALIVGMARSGVGSAKLLAANGWRVIANDMRSDIPGLTESLSGLEVVYALGRAPETLFDGVDMMVISPVIPMHKPFVQLAKARGIEVIGEIELGYRFSKGDFYCITGTNGKTTCTALTGEIMKAGGKRTFVLGNIGDPITEHAAETKAGDVIVAETAGLQLEGNSTFHAHGAAVCNITEDHLDHFLTMENYIAAKKKIFDHQTAADFAVLNYDDPVVRDMANDTKAAVLYFSRKAEPASGVFLRGADVLYRFQEQQGRICRADEILIPGVHNLENAMLSAALGLCAGVEPEQIRSALAAFGGVEHRMERVCETGGVLYVNDSKGTNPDSTIKAIAAMDRPCVLLLGGYDKNNSFDGLFAAFNGKIKAVVALGATAKNIIAAGEAAGYRSIHHCTGDFHAAVDMARSLAAPGDAVLLSPACASWDMFSDYEARGRAFKQIVRAYS